MTDLFNLASIKTEISINFRKFNLSEIIFNIIYTEEPHNVKTIFVLRNKTIEGEKNYEFLIVGFLEGEIVPVNEEGTKKALSLLLNYSDSDLKNIGLSKDNIINAIDYLGRMKKIDDLVYAQLFSNIFVLFNPNEEIRNTWGLKISSIHDTTIKFKSFDFIGTKGGSNDYITFTSLFDSLDYDVFKKIHLLEDFYIFVDRGKGFEKEYTAICTKIERIREFVKFYFSSWASGLQKSEINFLNAKITTPFNLMYLILKSSGIKLESINVEGFKKPEESNYSVTILVENLVLKEQLGLGLVKFCPPESQHEIFNDFPDVLRKKIVNLNKKYCWATVALKSDNLSNAYNQGRRKILQAIDLLSSIVRDDYLFDFYSLDNSITNWDRDNATPNLTVTTIANLYNNFTGENVTIDFQNILEPTYLIINRKVIEKVQKIKWADLILINGFEENKSILSLINSLKWLRRSWYADSIEDKVIYNNIAVEFMISDEKVSSKYGKEILEKIEEKLSKINFTDEDMKEEIKNKVIKSLKDVNYQMKLDSLVKRLNIPVIETDLDLLKKVRDERNKIIHGSRECKIDDLEMSLANNIICMMVIRKLYSLKDS